MTIAGMELGEELSNGQGVQRTWSLKWLSGELRTGSPPGWAEMMSLGVCALRLEGGPGMQLQTPNPAPHPQRPPTLPSTELSPPVGHLYSLRVLAPVQGVPGWLQRQEDQGLRPTRSSPLLPSLPPIGTQQAQG